MPSRSAPVALVLLTAILSLATQVWALLPAQAAAGDLDTGFSGDGKVMTDLTAGYDGALGIAIQQDGKIVAAGYGGAGFELVRYNADGTLDPSFDDDGKVTTNFTTGGDGAYAVAIQQDGRIVAAGYAADGGRFALARYKTDGSLDTTFDGDGMVTTDFSVSADLAMGVAIQGDGRIVAAGYAFGSTVFALARYQTDGSLDATFDGDGKVTTDFTANLDIAHSVAIQANGKLLAAGYADGGAKFALARYDIDGTLDTTFSGDGKTTTPFSGGATAYAIVVQPDGKIVAAGSAHSTSSAGSTSFALARYTSGGILDTAFSGDGKLTTDYGPDRDQANGIALQGDGKLVVAGLAADTKFGLARYKADGTLDTSFSGDGKATTNFTSGRDGANGVAIQTNGMIVAAGAAATSQKFALARYGAA
jgi:uncharacterized delta-60 repeat protein